MKIIACIWVDVEDVSKVHINVSHTDIRFLDRTKYDSTVITCIEVEESVGVQLHGTE